MCNVECGFHSEERCCCTGLSRSQPAAYLTGGSEGSQASQLAASVAYPGLAADGLVDAFPLDHSALQGCGRACMEESLKVTTLASTSLRQHTCFFAHVHAHA